MNFYGQELPVFRANLHTHTTASDGKHSPQEVISRYAAHGYDVLALTDHRQTTPVSTCDPCGMTLIPAAELHPMGPRNILWHLVALGVPEGFPGIYETAQEAIDAVHAAGGFLICAHPNWCGLTSADILQLRDVDAVEVYNHTCRQIGKADSEECWNELINAGWHIGAVAVDDMHGDAHFFGGWTMIAAEDRSIPSLMNALRQGHFYATQGPEFSRITLENGVLEADYTEAEEVIILSTEYFGMCITTPDSPHYGDRITSTGFCQELPEKFKGKPVRLRIRDKAGHYAWSAPILVK